MAVSEQISVEPGLIPALARHLIHLKGRPDGGELYQLIQDALLHCRQHAYGNASSIAYLHGLMLTYTKDHAQPSPVRIRARLIQQYLALYLLRPDHVATAKSATHAEQTPLQANPARETNNRIVSMPAEALPMRKRNPNSMENAAIAGQGTAEQNPATAMETLETPTIDHGPVQVPDKHRQLTANSVDELLREREALAHQLSHANSNIKMIEAEREQIRAELNKALKRTRTSEKSSKKIGLPKRDVLLRQIEAEVERVKRHGNPLALVLIDVENLETINDQHGREVTKALLDHYTSEILGGFRSYDLVTRYNKDEFAVLLPNTDKEKATRALEKIRKRTGESHFSHKGRSYPLPGFGGVLTLYAPGEEPQQMLRRADEALVNRKLSGEHEVMIV